MNITPYQLAIELDKAIKRTGNDLRTACLYRSFAGAVLLSKGSNELDTYSVQIGELTIVKGDYAVQLGPKGAYSINEEPQRALDNGQFHAWIKRRAPPGVIDLSASHFSEYDKSGRLGKLRRVGTVLEIDGASKQLGDEFIGYLSSEPATLLANDQFLGNGIPDQLWQITHDVGKVFEIKIPSKYKLKRS